MVKLFLLEKIVQGILCAMHCLKVFSFGLGFFKAEDDSF